MPTVELTNIRKTFGPVIAVEDVSFNVEKGEIFGLLGPNGAGKTTSIRVLLDIFKPEHGHVAVLGGPMTEAKKDQIGYMPEDRGLYQDIELERCLVYLGSLKNMEPAEARRRMGEYLERFDLAAHKHKKVKELSKGMQQKAQLITTLVHKPEVVIIDEPFSALDPVNTQMVKDLLKEERHRGTTIVMCTHQMHQVEELADRIALINAGETVLYGGLTEIRRRFASDGVLVRAVNSLPSAIPGVQEIRPHNSSTLLKLENGKTPQEVLNTLIHQGIILEHFEIALPSLDEIFIQVVNHESE